MKWSDEDIEAQLRYAYAVRSARLQRRQARWTWRELATYALFILTMALIAGGCLFLSMVQGE
jgi:hypothetical protein